MIRPADVAPDQTPRAAETHERPRASRQRRAPEKPDSPLFDALESVDLTYARAVLEDGADPNIARKWGEPALEIAVRKGRRWVELLLEYGADPDIRCHTTSALHGAILHRQFDVVEPLIEAGANPNLRNEHAQTVLHMVAGIVTDEPEPLIRMLLDAGANLEARDSTGDTPLIRAAVVGNEAAVAAFIEGGADVTARTDYGRTAIVQALRNNRPGAAKVILRKIMGRQPSKQRARATRDLHTIVAQALAREAGVCDSSKSGETPLHMGVEDPELVSLLLRAGADPNAADEDGASPLHRAAAENLPRIAALLVEAGADPNAKDSMGRTPLDIAREAGAVRAVKRLTARGRIEGTDTHA